jgi:hypothetical protein
MSASVRELTLCEHCTTRAAVDHSFGRTVLVVHCLCSAFSLSGAVTDEHFVNTMLVPDPFVGVLALVYE